MSRAANLRFPKSWLLCSSYISWKKNVCGCFPVVKKSGSHNSADGNEDTKQSGALLLAPILVPLSQAAQVSSWNNHLCSLACQQTLKTVIDCHHSALMICSPNFHLYLPDSDLQHTEWSTSNLTVSTTVDSLLPFSSTSTWFYIGNLYLWSSADAFFFFLNKRA